jgi:hypothetical protein
MSNPLRDEDDDETYEGLLAQLADASHETVSRIAGKESWRARFADRKISPRVRLAAKYYNSGIAKTLREAAHLACLHPGTLYAMNASNNEEFNRISGEAAKNADIATGDISAVLQRLGRNALITIEDLRAKSESEAIRLKAAIDLADRSPETSKVQKMQVQTISMDGKDVEALTKALVESEHVQRDFKEVTVGDFVKVTTEVPSPQLSLPTPNMATTDDVLQSAQDSLPLDGESGPLATADQS